MDRSEGEKIRYAVSQRIYITINPIRKSNGVAKITPNELIDCVSFSM